jgi:hypothetical protein
VLDLCLQGGLVLAIPVMKSLLDLCRSTAARIPGCTATVPGGLSFVWRGSPGQVVFSGTGDGVFDLTEFLLGAPDRSPARMDLLMGQGEPRAGGAGIPAKNGACPGASGRSREGADPHPPVAWAILNPAVRRALGILGRRTGIRLLESPTGVRLGVLGWPVATGDLDCWLVAAFQVFQTLGGAWAARPAGERAGIQERLGPGARCPVCGASLVLGRLVRCGRCQTPHHLECWGFNRRCSVYACGGEGMSRVQNPEPQSAAPFL